MAKLRALDKDEARLWRSLMRLVVTVPRMLDEQIQRDAGLSGTEYSVLVHLSEAPDRQLRMSDLADRLAFSAGRVTRIVEEMSVRGLVVKQASPGDRRSALATLTDDGHATLERAYPLSLATIRRHVFDHLDRDEVQVVGDVLDRLKDVVDSVRTESRPGRAGVRPPGQ